MTPSPEVAPGPSSPVADATAEPAPRLHRDATTFAFYAWFVMWGWVLYSFNPSVPLLAADLGVSNALAGLHGTAMAVGSVLAAFAAPWGIARLGRREALVTASGLVVAGMLALLLGPSLAVTLPGMVVLALGGNVALSAAQAGLTLHHTRAASAAVTEANGIGSGVGLVGPLAVGACVALGWGWRPAVAVAIVLAVAAALLNRRRPVGGAMTPPRATAPALVPEPEGVEASTVEALAPHPRSTRTLHGPSRAFLAAVVAGVAIEMSTTFWSTELVREQTGAGAGIAAATTAGLLVGMTSIRFVVGPLSLRLSPVRLLTAGFLVAIVGWAVLWTASTPAVAIAGLVVAGLGYGVQYPLACSLLLATAPGATDAAQARITMGAGVAVGIAPFVLGWLADQLGIHGAFVIVPVLAVLGVAAAVTGGVLASRRH